MKKLFSFLIVVIMLFSSCSMPIKITKADSNPLKIKVLTIAMFEVGKMTGDTPGEAQFWVEGEKMTGRLKIPGMMFPVCYNDRGHALMVTQMGFANAASSVMSLGMNGFFDLSEAYIIIAGIAGVNPAKGTLGSAAWAKYIIDGDWEHYLFLPKIYGNRNKFH